MKIILPMPPSVNVAYRGMSRRFKSKQYIAWLKTVSSFYDILPEIDGKLSVKYKFFTKWHNKDVTIKKKDASNYFKILDDFVFQKIDDSQIFHIVADKIESDRNEVEMEIEKCYCNSCNNRVQ